MQPIDLMKLTDVLNQMRDEKSTLDNYALPGLSSTLLPGGRLRMFECHRNTPELIAPHSHRYDFACLVLAGSVVNTVYKPCKGIEGPTSDFWAMSILTPIEGGLGDYEKQVISQASCFTPVSTTYRAGDVYSMLNDDIHSIQFSRGAQVLFIEGPERSTTSIVLEPSTVDLLSHVPTFETRPWMFKRRN